MTYVELLQLSTLSDKIVWKPSGNRYSAEWSAPESVVPHHRVKYMQTFATKILLKERNQRKGRWDYVAT